MSNQVVSHAVSTTPNAASTAIVDPITHSTGKFAMALDWLNNNSDLVLSYALHLVSAIVIIMIGFAVANFISKVLHGILIKRKLDSTVADFITHMVRYIVLGIVFIAALSTIGVQTTSFIALIGAAGLAIGLALQGSLSNFASGILIIILRPFKAGDYIEAGGTAGTVESVAIFATTLISIDNKSIVVPNASILNGSITNYSAKDTRRIDLVIGVSYGADLSKTKAVLEDVLKRNKGVLTFPEYQIGVAELADSSVNLVVRPWVKTTEYWPVRFELMEEIKNSLDEAGIEIPFPQMDVHTDK